MEDDAEDKLTELDLDVDVNIRAFEKKLANERDKLQRPDSASSNNGSQLKLHQAMIRRHELLDRIRQEHVSDDQRPRTYSPRRRYTPSPLPPPSRRSLPDLSRNYHFNWYHKDQPHRAMSQTKHIIEHQFRPAESHKHYMLPPIQTQAIPQVTTIQAPPSVIQQLPPVVMEGKQKDTMFNKSDFMDMMMLQNAQMHHMVMQQMMLQNLPGGGGGSWKMPTAQVPMAPMMEPMRMAAAAPVMPYAAPPVMHHYQQDPRGYGRGYYGDYSPYYY